MLLPSHRGPTRRRRRPRWAAFGVWLLAALVVGGCSGLQDFDPDAAQEVDGFATLKMVYKGAPLTCVHTRIRNSSVLMEDTHEVTSLSCDFAGFHAAHPDKVDEPPTVHRAEHTPLDGENVVVTLRQVALDEGPLTCISVKTMHPDQPRGRSFSCDWPALHEPQSGAPGPDVEPASAEQASHEYAGGTLSCLSFVERGERRQVTVWSHELSCDFTAFHAEHGPSAGASVSGPNPPTRVPWEGRELPCLAKAGGIDCDWSLLHNSE